MACVDIIMAVYNDEEKVAAAIESILSQTYKDWRLIVCDDGSSDNTYSILKTYAQRNPDKIIVIKNKTNRGLTYTLNRLLSVTSATYVARMDSDDRSKPKRLERQIDYMEKHPEYSVVGSSIEKFDEDGCFGIANYPERPVAKDFLWNNPFAHPSVVFRAHVIKSIGGYRDEPSTLRCEDYDLWMRLYAEGYKGYNIQEPLLEYFEGRSSYVKRKFKYRIAEMKTRFYGYKRMGLIPRAIIYTLKPLFVGILPTKLMIHLRKALI